MTAVKAYQAEAFINSPDARLTAFLVYGPDAGLVSERAARLAAALARREKPEGEILRLDDLDLEDKPDRLAIELGTVPMFGGRKIIRAATGRRINTLSLKPLVEGGPLAGLLIVETGQLRPDDALRLLFEKAPAAVAVPCYADEAPDLNKLVQSFLAEHGFTMTNDAREALIERLGADRAVTRSELQKLAVYAHGQTEVGLDDIEAIVGDASEQTMDRILTAAATGDTARTTKEYARALSAGESAQAIISATDRYFQRLHRIRAARDAGRSFEDIFKTLKPRPNVRVKSALDTHSRIWNLERLETILARIALVAKAAREAGPLEEAHAERLLIYIARVIGHERQRTR